MSLPLPPHNTTANTNADAPASEARRRGRALAARLTRLAGGAADPADLPRRIVAEVLAATGGARVSLWRVPVGGGAASGPTALECVLECASGAPAADAGDRPARQARAAAWLAMRAGERDERRSAVVEWAPRPSGADTPVRPKQRARPARPGLVALPLGARQARAARMVLVVAVDRAHLAATAALLRASRGALDAVARVALLAADLERANRRHGQLQAVFDNSSEAIVTVDRDYQIVEMNAAFATLMERDPAEMAGRHCCDVLACRDVRGQTLCRSSACPLAQSFVSDHATPYRDLLWRGASDATKLVSASFASVPALEGPPGIITAHDVSKEKAASRMQANFISMVSHDLRTPLTTINGFLHIVLEGMAGALHPKQEEFLAYALSSTQQLMGLVEEVLTITRADAGQFSLRLDTVDVLALVTQSVRNFQSAARDAQVNLRLAVPRDMPPLVADERRLQQVLGNLINNAIKFTPPEGRITVEAAVDRDSMRFSVRDTGEGVPDEDQTRIFERFVRLADESGSTDGGYGLGLAIARMIVHQHGGRIWMRNAPEGGAIFTFTIPLTLRPTPAGDPNG